jgi:hypothetical protein
MISKIQELCIVVREFLPNGKHLQSSMPLKNEMKKHEPIWGSNQHTFERKKLLHT